MSSLHPARRSAERFSSLLQGERAATDPLDAELLELVGALQTLPRVEARPEFVSDLRERLLLAADTELLPSDSPARLQDRLTVRTGRTPRERRLAVALGGFAVVGATTSMAVAAQSALPGDVLYPLKRAIESAEAGVSVSDEAKGTVILDNATGRLDEVDKLAHQDEVDPATLSDTLTTFSDQASEASELLMADYEATGSEDSINELRDFASTSIETLADLEEVIPEGAEDALLAAAEVVFQIDTLAANLCPVCDSLGIVEIPVPLLASGDLTLDDAAVEAATTAGLVQQDPTQPGGTGDKPDQGEDRPPLDPGTSVTEPTDHVQVPTETATGNSNGNTDNGGGTVKNPPNPLGSGNTSLPTSLPSLGLPEVDEVVSGVVEGVNGVVGGLAGTTK